MSRLPFPEKVLTAHIAVLGKTGSGKSSALRVIVEHLLDKNRRLVVVDPKGDWWGLKSSGNGKSAGYPVIAFGSFKEPRATDVPLNESSGKYVAELIATGNRPCIVGFRGWMPAQMMRFWIGTKDAPGFAQTLFNANEGELYVVIDEVHNFAPKGKVLDPDSGKSLHWTNRIMSEGRGLGMTFLIASQRPQKVHNDTLENCETLVAMRVTHPRSREATEEWINAKGDPALAKQVMSTLAELNRGEAWVWSPENEFGPKRVQFPMFETFDSFAPPQLQKKVSQAGWSEVDLDQVKQTLATVIAEAKANDPKELKAEISRLKHEFANKKHVAPATKLMPASDPKAIERAVKLATTPLLQQIETMRKQAKRVLLDLQKDLAPLQAIANLPPQEIPQIQIAPPAQAAARVVHLPKPPASVSSGNGDERISGAQVRILSRLVELAESTGQTNVRKEQLAAWCEYSPIGGGYTNHLGALRSGGMIDYPAPGYVSITDAGRAIANPDHIPTTSGEMLARAKRVLGGSEGKLLEVLHREREAMSKEFLAGETGFSATGGGFTNYLGHMRTLGFVEYPAPGQVRCADWLYLDSAESARA